MRSFGDVLKKAKKCQIYCLVEKIVIIFFRMSKLTMQKTKFACKKQVDMQNFRNILHETFFSHGTVNWP